LTNEDHEALRIKRLIDAENAMVPTDSEKVTMMRDALKAEYGAENRECIVADTISEKQQIIYWWSTPMGPYPKGPGEYFMSTWTETNGKYEFSNPKPVRRMTTYEPVANAAAVQSAGNAEVAAAVNTDAHNGQEESMSDKEHLDLAAQVASLVTAVDGLAARFTKIETAAQQDPNPAIAGLKTTVANLVNEFAAMRGVTAAAVEERERERQDLIRQLAGHFRVPFTAADLEAKPLDELRKLHTMAQGNNFEGRGGPQGGGADASTEDRFAEPTPWDKQKEGGK